MNITVSLSTGLPLSRASFKHTEWPPAETGFHAFSNVFETGPPAESGFPYTQNSGLRHGPASFCIYILLWASHRVGLPKGETCGLRDRPASEKVIVNLSTHLPRVRASLALSTWPPG